MKLAHSPLSAASAGHAGDPVIGVSHSLLAAKKRVAESGKFPLLFVGETGAGKSNMASYAHWLLQQNGTPRRLLWVNSACQTHETLQSLAQSLQQTNPAEPVDLILEEIGDSSAATQAFWIALWDANRQVREMRFIATSQQDLGKLTLQGRFRPELFSRLGASHIHLAPLRNRREDIAPLFSFLFQKHFGVTPHAEPAVLEHLVSLSYRQGNVRELEEIILRLGTHLDGCEIALARLQLVLALGSANENADSLPVDAAELGKAGLEDYLDRQERRILEHFLRTENLTMKQISKNLKLSRPTLYRKLKKHGLLQGRLPVR